MKFRLLLSCVAGLLGSAAVSAQAGVQLAQVTNNVVTSGACTLGGVNGGNGWASFRITCGADAAIVTHSTVNGSCSTSVSAGYSISGGCTSVSQNSYTLYRTTVEPPKQQVLTWLTDVTGGMTANGPGCTVQSAGGMSGGGNTYVGYRVVCGSTVLPVTLTYNYLYGSCSVSSAPTGYVYSGGCNSYSVYRIDYQ